MSRRLKLENVSRQPVINEWYHPSWQECFHAWAVTLFPSEVTAGWERWGQGRAFCRQSTEHRKSNFEDSPGSRRRSTRKAPEEPWSSEMGSPESDKAAGASCVGSRASGMNQRPGGEEGVAPWSPEYRGRRKQYRGSWDLCSYWLMPQFLLICSDSMGVGASSTPSPLPAPSLRQPTPSPGHTWSLTAQIWTQVTLKYLWTLSLAQSEECQWEGWRNHLFQTLRSST